MTYTRFLRSFFVAFVLLLLLDWFWHKGIMADFYGARLMMVNPGLDFAGIGILPQMLFINLLNAVTVTYVVLHHKGEGSVLGNAAFVGGLLGLTVVGTLNFLNNAFVPAWDTALLMIDSAWGIVVGIIAGLSVAVTGIPEERGLFSLLKKKLRK
jgi:uncharacterized membrane protein